MHRSRVAAAVLAAALAAVVAVRAVPAAAQQEADEPAGTRVPTIVVSATRIESTLATSPDAITVVTREEIEQLQARFVADVLETVPGVIVSRSGQPGAQTTVFLRGASGVHTLVLVDGVRVNNAFSGRFDFANLTVDNVERIEVVRGPQSTRYGSDALGGVINIVTRKSAAASAGAAALEMGTNDSVRARGSIGANLGQLSLSAEASLLDTDNERPNSQYHTAGGSFGATWRSSDRLDIALTGAYRESRAGTPNDVFTSDPNDRTRTEAALGTLIAHAVPVPWWDARLSLSAGHERMRFDGSEPNPPSFFGDVKAETTSDSQRIDLQNVFAFAPRHRLFLGLSHDRTPTEYTSTSAFGETALDETMTATAVSGQYDWSPAKSFTASLGARVDDFSSFGTHATWRAGGRYTVAASGTILRANAGTGFRAPTVADLFFPGSANPDLQPEESAGWDVGFEQPLLDGRLQVGAAWFNNDLDNLIQWSPASYRMENVAKVRTSGLETFLQWAPTAALALNASYTWLATAQDEESGARLDRRPEHAGSLAVHYRFPRWAQLDTSFRFAGSSNDKHWAPDYSVQEVKNNGYVTWDLGVTVTPLPRLSLIARVENLLDEEYAEAYGFPALGRTVWGGVSVSF